MAIQTIPAATAGGGLEPKYQKFTTSGTFTLPAGYGAGKPLLVNVQVIGGGGGGSGYTNDSVSFTSTAYVNASSYFGQQHPTNVDNGATYSQSITPKAGGSGGIAATQMYLTSNLTITVGAAGTRTANAKSSPANFVSATDNSAVNASNNTTTWENNTSYTTWTSYGDSAPGGSGGTSSAGSVFATGGNGATAAFGSWAKRTSTYRSDGGAFFNNTSGNSAIGNGGTPAGTAADATPLLGAIAGGSSNATSVKGSFGIGGVLGDAGTSTGVEGTGGGGKAIAASGAVILTWWE